jgi:archaemetzincin
VKPTYIKLVSFGFSELSITEDVAVEVKNSFKLPVKTCRGKINLDDYYNPQRNQYDGNALLKFVELEYTPENAKTLALFNVDLFIPILTFIFGQAYLNGSCGIASVFRLANEMYGLKPDEKTFVRRIRKEVIHELGHTFGLRHCADPWCVMRSSTYVEDIDQKNWSFCIKCAELLHI